MVFYAYSDDRLDFVGEESPNILSGFARKKE
jgi:hypothetical protein